MKGLELAESYFQNHGWPMIRDKFGQYTERIAAGLVGDGSECFGFDDELSRDHDWGPGFCLWLTKEDFREIGRELTFEVERLPQSYLSFGPKIISDWGFGRTGVFEISSFYLNFTGLDRPPSSLDDWLCLPENTLAACTNGRVFHDPLGEFTKWRGFLLEFYPEDVRLKKIASRCMTIAQSGQYNLERCLKRKEYYAAAYTIAKFGADVISMTFLLNRKYTPFYKWMHRAVKDLPLLGEWTHLKISELTALDDDRMRIELAEEICQVIISELRRQGLSGSDSGFLLDHGPAIQNRIKDPELRQRNVWVG